jgi:hypothetical protein
LALLLVVAGGLSSAGPASGATLKVEAVNTSLTNVTLDLPISLGLEGGDAVSAFQCDVVIEGTPLSLVSADALPPLATAAKELSVNPISPTRWRLVVSGFNQTPIAAGELVMLGVGLAAGAESGFYAVSLENAVLSSPNGGAVPVDLEPGGIEYLLPSFHTGDVDKDLRFSLSELLRVIQIYNAGRHHCEPGTEDGYALGPGPETCAPHSSDYSGGPDWMVALGELLRVIQFYTIGGYQESPGTEDGFAPRAPDVKSVAP